MKYLNFQPLWTTTRSIHCPPVQPELLLTFKSCSQHTLMFILSFLYCFPTILWHHTIAPFLFSSISFCVHVYMQREKIQERAQRWKEKVSSCLPLTWVWENNPNRSLISIPRHHVSYVTMLFSGSLSLHRGFEFVQRNIERWYRENFYKSRNIKNKNWRNVISNILFLTIEFYLFIITFIHSFSSPLIKLI